MGEQCRYAHSATELRPPPQLDKTMICASVKAGKVCSRGAACTFAHWRGELRQTINHYKTNMCRNWQLGRCSKPNTCNHAHGEEELSFYRRLAATRGCRNFTKEQHYMRFDPFGFTPCGRVASAGTDTTFEARTSLQGERAFDCSTDTKPLPGHHSSLSFPDTPDSRFYSGTSEHNGLQRQLKSNEASASDWITSSLDYIHNTEANVTGSTRGCLAALRGRGGSVNARMQAKVINPHTCTQGQKEAQSSWPPHAWLRQEATDMIAKHTDETIIDRRLLENWPFEGKRDGCAQHQEHRGLIDAFEVGDSAEQLDHQRKLGTKFQDSGRNIPRLHGLMFDSGEGRLEAQRVSGILPSQHQVKERVAAVPHRQGRGTVATQACHNEFFLSSVAVLLGSSPLSPASPSGPAESSTARGSVGSRSFGSPSTLTIAPASALACPQQFESSETTCSPWKQTLIQNADPAIKTKFSHGETIVVRSHGWRTPRGFLIERPEKDSCAHSWNSTTLPRVRGLRSRDTPPNLSLSDQHPSNRCKNHSFCHTFGASVWKRNPRLRGEELPGTSRTVGRSERFCVSVSTKVDDSGNASANATSTGLLDDHQQAKLRKHVERVRRLQQLNNRSGKIVFWGTENIWGYSTAGKVYEGRIASNDSYQRIFKVDVANGTELSRWRSLVEPHESGCGELHTGFTWLGRQLERVHGFSSLTKLVAFLRRDGVRSGGKATSLRSMPSFLGVTEGFKRHQSGSGCGGNGAYCWERRSIHEQLTQGYENAMASSSPCQREQQGDKKTDKKTMNGTTT
ncbi:putative zinc finger (CCCH type) protein [Neospora caninum Liverpool]|nr:putative zinc finger (CCCH type) protein [Neospora caninum Liverpool]CBZ54231.1 putative zinc finger (CCCH type) protein [Neospora caninum Liverpool]|eukprot:XP_003884262.1 putative zinc finger (CCCH type) protein [Neospora caninum Liverpool]